MSYHPRIETKEIASFITTRTRNSELWFVNNPKLEECILGNAAKCAERYGVKLYALAIEGNHIHAPALFPEANRADFMRDFNSAVARAVPKYVPSYTGGRLWARRYSSEFMPGFEDIEDRFFYTVMQPIQDGLVDRISQAPGYNCFHDAVHGICRKFKIVRWSDFHAAKRYNQEANISDYMDTVALKYERLPGYAELSQEQYAQIMLQKLEARRVVEIQKRASKGLGYVGLDKLRQLRPGSLPRDTKTSSIRSHRPRVLSICAKRRAECLAWYFDMFFAFKEASRRYRLGELGVVFPEGTYRPYFAYAPPLN